jgi:hypothetical protein
MKKQKPKKSRPARKPNAQPEGLKGWAQIAQFLGQPIAVAQALGQVRDACAARRTIHDCISGRIESISWA